MIPTLNWRVVFCITIALRFIFALSNSYIHPDEHFQSFEVITGKVLGYSINKPWEFNDEKPARSLGPLYLFYSPLLYIVKYFNLELNPMQIWYLIRLQNTIIGWMITDLCLYKMLPTKQERLKAIFFTLTSYVTLIYQTHGFSNSIETILVLISIYIIDELRFTLESPKAINETNDFGKLWWLGVICSIGIFNRITFPAFLLLPCWFLLKYIWVNKVSSIFMGLGFIITSFSFILIDSIEFNLRLSEIIESPFNWSNYVVTPLNNLIYNSSYENLSHHGIHFPLTHLFINLPQILGPAGLIFLFGNFKNRYWKTTPFLSVVGAIVLLSIIPHQELRFLTPMVPLLCACFDIASLASKDEDKSSNDSDTNKNSKSESKSKTKLKSKGKNKSSSKQKSQSSKSQEPQPKKVKSNTFGSLYLNIWYLFNLSFCILMGVFHQGGVIPALDYFHDSLFKNANSPSNQITIQIWWRTYSPPTWMLGDSNNSTQYITISDENLNYSTDSSKSNFIFDTMGTDFDKVQKLIEDLKSEKENSGTFSTFFNSIISTKSTQSRKLYLIAPTSSFNLNFQNLTLDFDNVWNYNYHLDLDHLSLNDIESFRPGLGIYEII